ncbi:hypothetical protein A1356_04830 [Methylomonas koyamae]|uniref:Uncharacterized protein n=1 Tax=Methylomonas koyamae TaxID=702114 RepID=A0AA91DF69_9GAMM|nr:hypothetical protein A1356_04830 [Methylomonas koyamae]
MRLPGVILVGQYLRLMQHLVNTFTAFAAEFFVAVDGFKFKTRYFNRQAAKIAIFFNFIRHDTNSFSFGNFQ